MYAYKLEYFMLFTKNNVLLVLILTFDRSIKRFGYSNHNVGTKYPKYIIDE